MDRLPAAPHERPTQSRPDARGLRIAFLDDDTVPEPGWIAAALALEPGASVARTGPELPVGRSVAARIAHAVSSSPIGRLATGHDHDRPRSVPWHKVPFSNFVTPRAVFDAVGPLAEDIPWDMDDFDFCLRARATVRFEADPALLVRHDRYPDSLRAYLRYVTRLRLRTGEKLVTHPHLYGRIPLLVACVVMPIAGGALVVGYPPAAGAALVGYAGVLLAQVPHARRQLGPAAVPPFLATLLATHALTIGATHVGLWKALIVAIGTRLRGVAGAARDSTR